MEIIEKLPPQRRGRKAKYPWDEWCDGQVRVAKYGVDFHVSATQFQATLHGRARTHGMVAHTRVHTEPYLTVTFQFEKQFQDGDNGEA